MLSLLLEQSLFASNFPGAACKLVPAWIVGKRTVRDARRLVFQLKSATDGHIPFFTSDALPHYADALLEVYGVWGTPPRQGTRGRLPKPRRYPPPDLCYAVVVKERAHGRVVHVTTRIVYGTTEQMKPPRSKLRGIKRISSS